MQKRRDAMKRISDAMGLDMLSHLRGIKEMKPVKSMFTPPKVMKKKESRMTEKERNNASVPDDLKNWIYRPEIAAKFDKPFQRI